MWDYYLILDYVTNFCDMLLMSLEVINRNNRFFTKLKKINVNFLNFQFLNVRLNGVEACDIECYECCCNVKLNGVEVVLTFHPFLIQRP